MSQINFPHPPTTGNMGPYMGTSLYPTTAVAVVPPVGIRPWGFQAPLRSFGPVIVCQARTQKLGGWWGGSDRCMFENPSASWPSLTSVSVGWVFFPVKPAYQGRALSPSNGLEHATQPRVPLPSWVFRGFQVFVDSGSIPDRPWLRPLVTPPFSTRLYIVCV